MVCACAPVCSCVQSACACACACVRACACVGSKKIANPLPHKPPWARRVRLSCVMRAPTAGPQTIGNKLTHIKTNRTKTKHAKSMSAGEQRLHDTMPSFAQVCVHKTLPGHFCSPWLVQLIHSNISNSVWASKGRAQPTHTKPADQAQAPKLGLRCLLGVLCHCLVHFSAAVTVCMHLCENHWFLW